MNKARRKEIENLITMVGGLSERIENLVREIEQVTEEEQDYFDNMPESFQAGDKGQVAEQAIGELQEASQDLEAIDLDTVTDALERAAE